MIGFCVGVKRTLLFSLYCCLFPFSCFRCLLLDRSRTHTLSLSDFALPSSALIFACLTLTRSLTHQSACVFTFLYTSLLSPLPVSTLSLFSLAVLAATALKTFSSSSRPPLAGRAYCCCCCCCCNPTLLLVPLLYIQVFK